MEYLSYFEDGVRVLWVYDDSYETRGSYALETDEETRKAEDEEIEKLESGELVALGCIIQRRGKLDKWDNIDSLWGIVIEGGEDELKRFARSEMVWS